MGLKALLSIPFAKLIARKVRARSQDPIGTQTKVFNQLLATGKLTAFGKDHGFKNIHSYEDFVKAVPVREYEDLLPYIKKVLAGESDVLWKGKPLYFSKTSGTTAGVKYIPISKASISNHINGARNAILMYIAETGKADFVNGKMIFLSGSPALTNTSGIPTGRLSGIVNHHIPAYLRSNQLPSYDTNCIEDWEQKVARIVVETKNAKMTVISGIPPWVQMYFEALVQGSGKTVKDIFPDFSLFIYGGVHYEPYRKNIEKVIGKKVDSIELYPASEGFIAYQDTQKEKGLLLILDQGIFYEFIQADEYFKKERKRISLKDVQLGIQYAIILNTNAGWWGYSIGDTVKFVSLSPYRIEVTGRIKHFISAFGEHVIAEEVEAALLLAAKECDALVVEFTVAPQVVPPEGGLPYHEWFIAFEKAPSNIEDFAGSIDVALQSKNIYYKDLRAGNILQTLKVRILEKDGFINYMRLHGKLGGQNKLPRLSNDRQIAEGLKVYIQNI
jgi:phenylacetate-coenzyme A ligase PaaK-like adenylate-forming protein